MLGILLIIFTTVLFYYNFYWKRRKLPPGPVPLPLIGNIHYIASQKRPYDVYLKWHKQYGPVHTFWLGEKPVVAVSDFTLMKETFIKDGDAYAGRDFFGEFQQIARGGLYGIGATEGELWKNHRRFQLQTFRNFGMGRNIEPRIMKEVERLISFADESIKTGIQEHHLQPIIEIGVGSIINQMLLGYRFAGEDESEFYRLKNLISENARLLGHPLSLIMNMTNITFWRKFPYFKELLNKLLDNNEQLLKFFESQIEKNRKLFATEGDIQEATNYVQAYLMEMKKREEYGNVGDFTRLQLKCMLHDLWVAGQETTSNTLNFAVLYLMTHLRVQSKMQAELDQVVGHGRKVSLADKPNLHYTNATINEIQRLCNLLPVNLFHRTTKDVHINGYNISKGTVIVPQICAVLYDEKIFPNHESFVPERFLDENGHLKKVEEIIPFSIGKRACSGESLARDELFLYVSNLFHEFKISPTDPKNLPSLEKIDGFGVRPHPYNVSLQRRINRIL